MQIYEGTQEPLFACTRPVSLHLLLPLRNSLIPHKIFKTHLLVLKFRWPCLSTTNKQQEQMMNSKAVRDPRAVRAGAVPAQPCPRGPRPVPSSLQDLLRHTRVWTERTTVTLLEVDFQMALLLIKVCLSFGNWGEDGQKPWRHLNKEVFQKTFELSLQKTVTTSLVM